MSKTPKPATLPKPKKLTKTSDVSTFEHEDLLSLVWSKLDMLLVKLFLPKEKDWLDMQEKQIPEYLEKLGYAVTRAREFAVICSDDERGSALTQMADQFDLLQKKPLPELLAETKTLKLVKSEIERPITVEKGGYPSREEVVGYIDIAANVHTPVGLTACTGAPDYLTEGYASWKDSEWAKNKLTLGVIQDKPLEPPSWSVSAEERDLWIDVRTSDVPVGQLIRELKTLREYLPRNAMLLVVFQALDADKFQMLQHEGFLIITADKLSALE